MKGSGPPTGAVQEPTSDLRIANARLKALIDLGEELASEPSPDQLLHRVCSAACRLFGATYVSLGTIDRTDGTVRECVTCGIASCEVDVAAWITTGDAPPGIIQTVIGERRARCDNHAGRDPSRLQLPALHPPVESFLAAPIQSRLHVYGWICLVGDGGKTFTPHDEHLVMALSSQVGRIYENLSLAADVQKRAEELERKAVERKEADLALVESEARYRSLVEWSPEAITVSRGGTLLFVNPSMIKLLGATDEPDLVGKSILDIVHPDLQDIVRARLRSHAERGGTLPRIEERLVRLDGAVIDVEIDGRSIHYKGEPALFSSMRDITERKRAEEARHTAEERTRFVLQHANVGVWDLDYASGVLQWSGIMEAQYGVLSGTFGGTFNAFVERIHPDDRASVLEAIGRAIASGADFSVLNRTIWPDGTVRWLSGAGRILIDEHGAPTRAVGISMDVTERRTLEQQFQQAQKMEAVGQLAGGVAHDFNNLLTVILGFCELLLADIEPGDRRQADISEIQKAGLRAAGLTRQLLAFSRHQITEPTRLDLNAVITDLQAMLHRLIREDVRVVLRLQPEPAPVTADRGEIEQVVVNLAVNARDAMPKGGTLTIETASVDLDEHYARTHVAVTPGPYVVITVSDTGTGMTPQVQARLFEPFFTTKEPGQGTGLGMATVYGIVTRSGGGIDIDSEVGRGTSFKLYFPRANGAETVAHAPPPPARPRAGTQTVLLVDDEAGLRELAKRLLVRQGYTVLIAGDAEEATRLFDENPSIDVLLTDVVMPGASGPELAGRLVALKPGLKVIYMSGYTDDTITQHGILKPGVAFLHKPFTSETLGRKIREVLEP